MAPAGASTFHGTCESAMNAAIPAAEDARRLAAELGEPQWVAAADAVASLIAGIRGDQEASERAAAQAERIAVPTGANLTIAFAQFGRIFAALGAGRHSDAYEAAERLLDPAAAAPDRRISRTPAGRP